MTSENPRRSRAVRGSWSGGAAGNNLEERMASASVHLPPESYREPRCPGCPEQGQPQQLDRRSL